jgi:hypothetical protein
MSRQEGLRQGDTRGLAWKQTIDSGIPYLGFQMPVVSNGLKVVNGKILEQFINFKSFLLRCIIISILFYY